MSHRLMPLRVGVFGCGRIASSIHLPILAGMHDVAVAAIADPDEARCHDALRLVPGAASHADFRESLATGQLDAVVVTLPNALHAPAATAAFEQGLHVYVEKPLALSVVDSGGLVAAWRTAKTVGMVGYNYRFLPSYQEARALIAADRVGRVIAIRSVFSSSQRTLPDWKRGWSKTFACSSTPSPPSQRCKTSPGPSISSGAGHRTYFPTYSSNGPRPITS